ncbi:hypothetical protein [Brucella pituitosa]|uniref:hypothetical protein n=1 Tax=Brucella pituitosa TaxID=571256 RepID=UPI0009A1B374|nr:hypothetical protein [Brucella pituitosa]
MNCAELPIQQMAEAAGKVIFGEMFSEPKDEDPRWVKQTWDRVVSAIEESLTHLPDEDMHKFARARIRERAFCEAADWHRGEAERKRACAEKNRTLHAQIATHMVSEAAIRSLSSQPVADECKAYVSEMQTSAGTDYFVTIKSGDRELSIRKHQWKPHADYEAAEYNWLFNGGEKPDILAYHPLSGDSSTLPACRAASASSSLILATNSGTGKGTSV